VEVGHWPILLEQWTGKNNNNNKINNNNNIINNSSISSNNMIWKCYRQLTVATAIKTTTRSCHRTHPCPSDEEEVTLPGHKV
jgi:hypothetical protein